MARLQTGGADPDFRRKRDEAMFRELADEARRAENARLVAAERVRVETQAAIDLRVLAKLWLKQMGAVDRPACPPPVVESPPPPPFPSAIWIGGRYDWNGLAWMWVGGHYEQAPQPGAVWVTPAQIALGGTVVIRAGRWVNVTATVGPRRLADARVEARLTAPPRRSLRDGAGADRARAFHIRLSCAQRR